MKTKRKPRLWSNRKLRFPRPNDKKQGKTFALRLISEADQRFAVVKELKRRLKRLIEDAGIVSVQKEMLAGRAVFLASYLQSCEVEALEGKQVDYGRYFAAVNALSGVLNKLGLEKKLSKELTTLESYVADNDRKREKETTGSVNIIEAIKDENLFRPFFGGSLKTWRSWQTALRVLHGLPVKSARSRKLIKECTGRNPRKLPKGGFETALLLCGRRSGKSKITAIVGAHAAVLAGYEKRLSKGEVGLVAVVCPTKSQGRIIKNYLRAIFEVPYLQQEIESEDRHSFTLRSGVRIEILPGDFRHTARLHSAGRNL